MAFLTGTGRHRVQITYFFRGQIGSWRPLGVGLVVGKRLHRLRHRCSSLEVSEPRPALNLLKLLCLLRDWPKYAVSGGVCGVGACTRPLPTQSEPRETSAPQIDRIPSARPSWRDRQYRELKKLFFSPPSKCPIDLSGPSANGTMLKQLHVASRSSSRNPRRACATVVTSGSRRPAATPHPRTGE